MRPSTTNRVRLLGGVIAVAGLATFGACRKNGSANGDVSRNWTPTKQDSYMGVPAADVQSAIQRRLAAKPAAPVTNDQWGHVKKLYGTFGQSLLWLDGKGVHQPRVAALLNRIAAADSDALRLDAFPLADLDRSLTALGDKPTADQLADADVMLTSAYVVYGESMMTGQLSPQGLNQAWHINNQDERVDSALTLSLREDDLAAGLVRMRPQDPSYDSLRLDLGRYRDIVSKGGWQAIPAGRALKRGDSDSPARIGALRNRLAVEGYLADSTGAAAAPADSAAATTPRARTGSGTFDRSLSAAVARFQTTHAIAVDSMLGQETLDALNVPADYRLAQIAANLERYRWMPRDLGQRYVLVNVPQFYLHAYDSGQKSLDMKVIVGQEYEDKATPVFADSMETVVFRPYWNVTPTIAAKEIFPKLDADPSYLEENDMEIWNDHGQRAVRQRPGPKNALGFVKFLFPNDYNIYLHDTPNHELFKKDVRAFSHGCIRVEKPDELAEWVLGWPADKVEAAMHGADNHSVSLPKKIPVYIVYFTAFVQDGQLNFGNDLYDRDNALVEKMRDASTVTPETQHAQEELRKLAGG